MWHVGHLRSPIKKRVLTLYACKSTLQIRYFFLKSQKKTKKLTIRMLAQNNM